MRETKRCREIVRGLLDFARQTPPRRQPTDLNDVARRAAAVVLNQLHLGHVSLVARSRGRPAARRRPTRIRCSRCWSTSSSTPPPPSASAAGRFVSSAGTRSSRRAATSPSAAPGVRTGAICATPARASPACRRSASCASTAQRASAFWLDPIYGRFNHVSGDACDEGIGGRRRPVRAAASSLVEPGRRCERCDAPTFAVQTADDEPIRWCTRTGCHFTWWEGRERRGPAPVVELSGRGRRPRHRARESPQALRAVLHHQGRARHRLSGSRSPGASSRATAARSRSRARRAREAGSRCACRSTRRRESGARHERSTCW